MSPGNLTEKYVKEVAVNWLASHYRERPNVQIVLPMLEVRVSSKTKLGWGRADGLIVTRLKDDTVHVASLEAKSSRRLFNLIPWYRDEKWLIHAALIGATGLVLAGLIGWTLGGWLLKWVFPLLMFFVVGLIYLAVTANWRYYRVIDVIAQVKRYPANEQWIASATDAYNQLNPEEQRLLRKECEKEGIGLTRVSAGKRVTPLLQPRTQNSPGGHKDFLVCYAREGAIRKQLFTDG